MRDNKKHPNGYQDKIDYWSEKYLNAPLKDAGAALSKLEYFIGKQDELETKSKVRKNSEKNLAVIQNFILHLTHSTNPDGGVEDSNIDDLQRYTPRELYRIAVEYIEEDHVDGKENPED